MWFWQVPFFPLHVVPWPFWSRNVKSFWQKQRFGWAWERKTATDFSLEERQKKHYLKHTRFLARWWWEMRAGNTIAFPCHFGVMRIHMCVSMFLWKHREWTCASMETIVDPWPKTHFKLLYTSVLDAKVFQVRFIKWAAVARSRVACVSAHDLSFRKDQ